MAQLSFSSLINQIADDGHDTECIEKFQFVLLTTGSIKPGFACSIPGWRIFLFCSNELSQTDFI